MRRVDFALAALSIAIGVGSVVMAVATHNPGLVFAAVVAAFNARLCIGFATMRMVASPEGVEIRNPLRRRCVRWDEVVDIKPTRMGLALRLAGGGRVVVFATRKHQWLFLKPRVDEETMAYVRQHSGREASA